MFAFLVCIRIQLNQNEVDPVEFRYLLAGSAALPESELQKPNWVPDKSWMELLQMEYAIPHFAGFPQEFVAKENEWRAIYEDPNPHKSEVPVKAELNDGLAKLIILRMLRSDKITNAVQDYVAANLGQRFIEPQSTDLADVFSESSPTSALIFVLSSGTNNFLIS